jgi:hypothetical protein
VSANIVADAPWFILSETMKCAWQKKEVEALDRMRGAKRPEHHSKPQTSTNLKELEDQA